MKLLQYIFSIKNDYKKNSLDITTKKKIIYILGFKITLNKKIPPETLELYSQIINLKYLVENIALVQKKHYIHTKELLWQNIASKCSAYEKIDFPIKKCLLLKYDNFWGIGRTSGPNLGDNIQTIAVKNIVDKLYPNIEYEYVDRDNLLNYSGEKAICILQGWFSHMQSTTFLTNKNIFPIYVGYHLEPYKEEDILYLLKYVPNYFKNKTIGCRDIFTKNLFKNLNIPSYLSRCLTLTLPMVKRNTKADTIYFVDIYDNYLKSIPKEFFKKYERITQRGCDKGFMDSYYIGTSEQYYFEKSLQIFEKYSKNAKLVITTCLHCAAPCIAMGIPVILFCFNDDKTRYSALNGIIPIYTLDDLKNGHVNWNPKLVNIENLKEFMIKNLGLTIKEQLGENINKNELQLLRSKIENYNILN